MDYPIFKINQVTSGNIYYSDFREFIYSLQIEKQKGYSIGLTIGKHNIPSGDPISSSLILAKLDYCLKWTRHLIQKVIQEEKDFSFMRIEDKGKVSFCSISDNTRTAFIASAIKPGHESISKSLLIESTTSHILGFQRRARVRKRVLDITRDECINGWNQHIKLLQAIRSDIERIKQVQADPFMSQDQLNRIRKRALKMGIRFNILQDGKPGVRLAGINYHSYKAADLFLTSIFEEYNAKVEPGYSVFMDRVD